jgi:EAL domain-containing protein (putative c-di-GMP-specific phosphodiesterase class I)
MQAVQEQDFAAWVLETLDRHLVPARLLVLELTEHDVRNQAGEVSASLRRLGDAGIEFSIDDFGTGHSSMQRLRDLRVHELKIDRSFVDGIVDNKVDREIVSSIIALAERLGYRVVAEGVERAEHVELLIRMGCSTAQGFLFASAAPADEFFRLAVDHGSIELTACPTQPAVDAMALLPR